MQSPSAIRSVKPCRLGAIAVLSLLTCLWLAGAAHGERTLFTANSGSLGGKISITAFAVNPDGTLTPREPVRTTDRPDGLAITPDARFLYAATSQAPGVRGYAIGAGGALTEVPGSPFASGGINTTGVAITPDGSRLLVSNRGTALNNAVDPGSVASYAIDNANGSLTPAVGSPFAITGVEDPLALAITPDGARVYVIGDATGATFDGRVAALSIDAASGALSSLAGSPFDVVGAQPFPAVISPDGSRLFVGNVHGTLDNTISALDVNQETGAVAAVAGSPFPTAGRAPVHLAIAPDGDHVFSAERADPPAGGGISVYGVGASGALTPVVGSPFNAGAGQYEAAAVTPDSLHAYGFVNAEQGAVAGFSRAADGSLAALAGSPFPTGDQFAGFLSMAITPTGTPEPAFSAPRAEIGGTTAFNASQTAVPGGLAKRYDWDFGDGASLADGGPTPTHTYDATGAYTASLTVTNDCGDDTIFTGETSFTGQTALCSGPRAATTSRTVEVVDSIAPEVTQLRVSKRFAPAAKRPRGARAAKLKRRAKVSYRLSEPATVRIAIEKKRKARKGKKRRGKRFRQVGVIPGPGNPGFNSRRFAGRIGKRKLTPGNYRVVVTATDAAGNVSAPKRRSFKVVPRPRR